MTLSLSIKKRPKITLGRQAKGEEALPPKQQLRAPIIRPQEPVEGPQQAEPRVVVTEQEQSPQEAVQSLVETPPTFNELEAFLREVTPENDPEGEPLHKAYFRRQQREADLLEQIHNGRIRKDKEYKRSELLSILRKTPGKHKAWAIEGLRVLEEMGVLQVNPGNRLYIVKTLNEL
jgi:hypothetical protein